MVQELKKDTFEQILKENETVLIEFGADWCIPCKMMAPGIEKLSQERTDVYFGMVDIDKEKDIADQFQIMSIPAIILFKKGQVIQRANGSLSLNRIIEMLD